MTRPRNVITRLEELRQERADLVDIWNDCEPGSQEQTDADQGIKDWDEENGEELTALRNLNEQGESVVRDWIYGAILIRETYFVGYCQGLCQDIGDLPKEIPAYLVIDWDKTADNIRVDYSEIDFDGVTYLVR